MKVTPAGQQIEPALAMGFEIAAFNLYLDALQQEVGMVEREDESGAEKWACTRWHRDMQAKIGWAEAIAAQKGHTPSILRVDTYERGEDGTVTPGGLRRISLFVTRTRPRPSRAAGC